MYTYSERWYINNDIVHHQSCYCYFDSLVDSRVKSLPNTWNNFPLPCDMRDIRDHVTIFHHYYIYSQDNGSGSARRQYRSTLNMQLLNCLLSSDKQFLSSQTRFTIDREAIYSQLLFLLLFLCLKICINCNSRETKKRVM